MGPDVTRRRLLCVGGAVAIAGCGSDANGGDDPGASDPNGDGEEPDLPEEDTDVREPERVLYIAAENEHRIAGVGVYDAIEIEPGGALQLEPGGCLQLEDLEI